MNFTLPNPFSSGSYSVEAIVFDNNTMTLQDTCKTDITVGAAAKPDLVITDWDLGFGTSSVAYTIKNQGTGAAAASWASLKIDDALVAESAVSALAVGEEKTLNFNYTYQCSAPGDKIEIIADGRSGVVESNETNNTLTIFLTCLAQPDLVIIDSWFQGNTLFYIIKNQGEGAAVASWTSLLNEGLLAVEDSVASLAPGEQRTLSFDFTYICTPPGDALEIVADGRDDIFESDDMNNGLLVPVTCSGQPDLVIDNLRFDEALARNLRY